MRQHCWLSHKIRRPVRSAAGQCVQADGQEVGGDNPGEDQQVEDLVVAEHGRCRVGAAHRAYTAAPAE
jgi:hypothetical protein